MKNVFFFYNINDIGGVETMFWELAKKYHKTHDITIYYKKADRKQLERLRRYVNVIQYTGQQIECEHAFFNYDTEPFIGNVKAKRYYQIIHADFKLQRNIKIRIDPKIDTYIAVSKSVADSFYEMCGVKCEVCPNPLTLEKIENPPFFLCAAQRMTSEKGKNRIFELINRLDKLEDFSYYFLLFTNQGFGMTSPNLVAMPSRLDVRPYIFGCDLFVALSDSEGRCYSVGEKLGYGTGHLLITPCPSFFEQGANDQNAIVMEFDMSNMDEVIEKIVNLYRQKKIAQTFKPIKTTDRWNRYLAKGKPTYEGLKHYKVRSTKVYSQLGIYDTELKCIPEPNKEFIVNGIRLQTLMNYPSGALVEVIEEVGES